MLENPRKEPEERPAMDPSPSSHPRVPDGNTEIEPQPDTPQDNNPEVEP